MGDQKYCTHNLQVRSSCGQPVPTCTSLALDANLSVLAVSSAWAAAGVTLHTTATRAPGPDSEGCGEVERVYTTRQAVSQ